MSKASDSVFRGLFWIGALLAIGVLKALTDKSDPVGEALLKTHAEQYLLLGQKVVDKEVGALSGTEMVPALFIYLLQDRSDPRKLLVSVSQSNGYSIGQVGISGSALDAQIVLRGEGKYWSDTITSKFSVPDKAYERAFTPKATGGVVNVSVAYYWIWRGPGVGSHKFANQSDNSLAVFELPAR